MDSNPDAVQAIVHKQVAHPQLQAEVVQWASRFHKDPARILGVGIHWDGVPFAAKLRDSLEQVSWNFLGLPHGIRILCAPVPKSSVSGKKTWDNI